MDKHQAIIEFFTNKIHMDASAHLPELGILIESSVVLNIAAGDVVFHENLPCPYYFILVQGLAKMVYDKPNNGQWVKSFLVSGDGFASLTALMPSGYASYSTVAIEPCTLIKLSFNVMTQLAHRHLIWANLIASVAMQYASVKESRERDLLTLTPEQRYLKIHQVQPIWLQRVTQSDLAKHLGVTAVGLNRIIKRVQKD
jgi:CRP-like cAMP-binding protein